MSKLLLVCCSAACLAGPAMSAPSTVGLDLVPGRLSFDAVVYHTAHWWWFEGGGLRSDERVFERPVALAGFTGRVNSVSSVRCYFDIGETYGGPVLDMYAQLNWNSGWTLRAGQFLLPVGLEAMTDAADQKMIYNSFIAGYAKPGGTRDIGALVAWHGDDLAVSFALVNGAGANNWDDNRAKDLCLRIGARLRQDLELAGRGYFGWTGPSEALWRTLAAEATYRSGSWVLRTEVQNHESRDAQNNAGYLEANLALGRWEPVVRADFILPQWQRLDAMMTGGVNLRPFSEHFVVMLNGFYRRNFQDEWAAYGFMLRVQAGL